METRLPVKGAKITFIQDTLTLGSSFGDNNLNQGKSYLTNKEGIFKIPKIKAEYERRSPYLTDLSRIITISCDNYITDTINLRNWKKVKDKPILDTIWLKPKPLLNESIIE